MQRSSSGNKKGTGAFIRTIDDYQKLAKRKMTVAAFKNIYEKEVKKDYPDFTSTQIAITLKNHEDFGKGHQLGTLTDYKSKISDVVDVFSKRFIESLNPLQFLERSKVDQSMTADKDAFFDKSVETLNQKVAITKRKPINEEDQKAREDAVEKLRLKNKNIEQLVMNQKSYDKIKNIVGFRKMTKKQLLELLEQGEQRTSGIVQNENIERVSLVKESEKQIKLANKKTRHREKYEQDLANYKAEPSQTRGDPPKPKHGDVLPKKPDEFEQDKAEEDQFKKITRKNVGKIDLSVKVKDDNVEVKPNVKISDIKKAIQKNSSRLKLSKPPKIVYHSLKNMGKTSLLTI